MTLDPRSALVHRLKFLSVVQELAKADFEAALDTVGLDSLEELSGGIGLLPRDLLQTGSDPNAFSAQRDRGVGNRYGGRGGGPLRDTTKHNTQHFNIKINSRFPYEPQKQSRHDLDGQGDAAPRLHTSERSRRLHPSEVEPLNPSKIRPHAGVSGTTRAEELRAQARREKDHQRQVEMWERQHGIGAQEAGWNDRFGRPEREAPLATENRTSLSARRKPPIPLAAQHIAEEDERNVNLYSQQRRRPSNLVQPPRSPIDPHAATYSGTPSNGFLNVNSPGGDMMMGSASSSRVMPRITFSSNNLSRINSTNALETTIVEDDNNNAMRFPSMQPSPLLHAASTGDLPNSMNLSTSNQLANTVDGGTGVRLVRTSSRGPKAKPKPGSTPVHVPLSPVPDKVVDRVAQAMREIGKQSDFSKLKGANSGSGNLDSTMSELKTAIDARIDSALSEHMAEMRRTSIPSGGGPSTPDANRGGSAQSGGRSPMGVRMYSPTRQVVISRDQPSEPPTAANPFGTYASIRTSDSPFESVTVDGDASPDRSSGRQPSETAGGVSPNRSATFRRQQQRQREEISALSDMLDQMLGDHAMVQLRTEKGLARLVDGASAEEQDDADHARMIRLKRLQNELQAAMNKTSQVSEDGDKVAQAELELDRIRRQLVEQGREESERVSRGVEHPPKGAPPSSSSHPTRIRGFIPAATVRAIKAAQATQHEVLRHNEDMWNTSTTSQYAFASRLTDVLLDDLVTELSDEMELLLTEYVEGLAEHELQ